MNKPMKLTPDRAIKDLNRYVKSLGYLLSDRAELLFRLTEEFAYGLNLHPYSVRFFLIQALKNTKKFQIAITDLGGDPFAGAIIIVENLNPSKTDDPYDLYSDWETVLGTPYSNRNDREPYPSAREVIIDFAMTFARRNHRKEITEMDVVEAILASGEQETPLGERALWGDDRLNTSYLTLAHIGWIYSEALWVKVDDIRARLGFFEPDSYRKFPEVIAPPTIRPAILSFLNDYPEYHKNCFLIMPFRNTTAHNEIKRVLKKTLELNDLNLIRADDNNYSDDLLSNVETYIYGCSSAIAVIEQISEDYYNPNVALEVGYFYGLRKPVCLLQEKGLKTLPSDLIGKLYIKFDAQDIEGTIPDKITSWLIDKGLVLSTSLKSIKR